MRNEEMRLVQADSHRNGITGESFYAVVFDYEETGTREPRRMLGVVFEQPGHVAILDVRECLAGNVAFAAGNSWRAEAFEPWLRKQIERDDFIKPIEPKTQRGE